MMAARFLLPAAIKVLLHDFQQQLIDIFGNIQRLDNTLGAFEERMAACAEQLENTRVQLENAKAEVQKPFPQEEDLAAKTARLNELNALLNLDKTENEIVDGERGEEEPSRSGDDRER